MVQGSFNWSSPHSTGPQTSVVDYTISKSTKWITWLERPKGAKDEEKRPRVPPANSGSGTLFHIFLSHRLLCENLLVTAVKPLQFQDEWRALEQNLILFCRITGVMRITPTIFIERGQTKQLNSNVRGLCNGPCTHARVGVRARTQGS